MEEVSEPDESASVPGKAGSVPDAAGFARTWKRNAQRRAARHGASSRNSYHAAHVTKTRSASCCGSSDSRASMQPTSELPDALSPAINGIEDPLDRLRHGSTTPLTLRRDATRRSYGTKGGVQSFPATLHVYDLRGAEATNNTAVHFGMGVFHVGVELFGVEWSYGYLEPDPSSPPTSGVYPVDPKRCPIGTYRQSVPLGQLRLHGARDAWWLLGSLASSWLGSEYHPFSHNCLHFCSELCDHLGVAALPAWVGRLAGAADIILTPLLQALDVTSVPTVRAADPNGRARARNTIAHPVASVAPSDEIGVHTWNSSEEEASLLTEHKLVSQRRTRLSVAMSVALDFEEKFSWALMTMLFQEAQRAKTVDGSESQRGVIPQSLTGFL